MSGLLVICGFAGTGKTTIGDKVADLLGVDRIGPDDYPDRWTGVLRRVESEQPLIVECNRLHRQLRDRIHGTDAVVVELTVPLETQRQRLIGRGEPKASIEKRIADRLSGSTYGDETTKRDAVIDTAERDPAEVALEIARLMGSPRSPER